MKRVIGILILLEVFVTIILARPIPIVGDTIVISDVGSLSNDNILGAMGDREIIINQLPLSNNRKRIKINDGSARTNGASSNEPSKQNSNDKDVQKTGRKRTGGQVATDARNQASENEKECYFKHQRLNPDGLEKEERLAQSKVTNECTGVLRSFEELANSDPLSNLFGAENNADLALIRGAAEFGNNFEDEAVKERMKNIFICKKHEDELVFNWKRSTNPNHIFRKHDGQGSKAACTVPNALLNKHGTSDVKKVAKPGRYLHKKEAEAFLRQTGAHLHIGIPMCQAHAEHIERWHIANAVEEDGMQVIPEIDYAGAARVEDHRSVYSDYDSIRSAFCAPQASGSSGQTTEYEPPTKRFRTDDAEADPTITEGMKSTLQAFLKEIGVERLFSVKKFSRLKVDTLRKKGDSCRRMRRTVYKIVAPGNEDILEEMDCKENSNGVWTARSSQKLKDVMEAIAERYADSAEWPDRRAVLAIVAPILSFAELEKFIPGLTPYRYNMARNHARGMSKPNRQDGEGVRNRFSPGRVQEFVDFITSEAVMIGLPYGSITAKTSAGDKMKIASTLRRQRNEHITQMYERYLEGVYGRDHGMGISRSAMWQILDTCSAHRKKAIVGLDEYIANGRDGFDYIYKMLQTMQDRNLEDRDFVEMATTRLKESHQYLETDFKLHVKEVSRVADHCIRHALSDSKNAAFATPCKGQGVAGSHQHDLVCDRCEQLKSILGEIRKHVSEYSLPENEKERFEAKYLAAEKAIMDMRRHQLRSVLSSTTRKNIVEKLGTEGNADALLTLDWAMKWLPTKARETQKDFFGKKGISWHITHVLRRNSDDNFEQRTLVHITEQDDQDSDTVLAILRHVIQDLKKFGVKSVIIRSDNAGCYHSSKILATMKKISKETEVRIMRYTFSEAQSGKSSCDRMASVIKRHLHAYIDQGNDVTQALDFIKAMESATKINGMKFFVFKLQRTGNDYLRGKPSIPDISLFYDATFNGRGIQVKKYSGIGNGQEIEEQYWKGKESHAKLQILAEDSHPYQTEPFQWSPLHCTRHIVPRRVSNDQPNDEEQNCEEEINERQQTCTENGSTSASEIIDDDEDILKNEEKHDYYDCPEPNCVEQFSSLGQLQRHIIIGKHKFVTERKTMRDFALQSFQVNIAGNNENRIRLHEPVEDIVNNLELIKDPAYKSLLQGWAMKPPRKRNPFSGKQKNYLDAAFNRGTRKRSEKVDVKQLAKQMEKELVGRTGEYRFLPNELLTATQISGHFSRRNQQIRDQYPQCYDDPEATTCSSIDDQDITFEEDEYEYGEDPMFYSVEDEMMELVAETDIIEETEEISDELSATPTTPTTTVRPTKSHHQIFHEDLRV